MCTSRTSLVTSASSENGRLRQEANKIVAESERGSCRVRCKPPVWREKHGVIKEPLVLTKHQQVF